MSDHLNPERRSLNMAAVKSKNTAPEMQVRKMVHAMGYRYRLHDPRLPGKPDLVFSSLRKVLFVHGCFWHSHNGCKRATIPKTHAAFWKPKLLGNAARDQCNRSQLKTMGWRVLTIWQCELKNTRKLAEKIDAFLAN